MTEFAHEETSYAVAEGEPPEVMGRNLVSAAHLTASATAFLYFAFLFAYFYLRSLNSSGMFQPKHVTPSMTLGTLVMALSVATAVLVRLALHDQRAGRRAQWRFKAAAALGAGLLAVVLQIVEWPAVGFGPYDGGYASVFFGWTAFNVLFLVCALVALENVLATGIRYRHLDVGAQPPPGHASGDPGRLGQDVADPLSLITPGLEGLSFYWLFLAGFGVVAWILLYLL